MNDTISGGRSNSAAARGRASAATLGCAGAVRSSSLMSTLFLLLAGALAACHNSSVPPIAHGGEAPDSDSLGPPSGGWMPPGFTPPLILRQESSIFVMNAEGGAERLASGSWPAWSPDGEQIAFQRDGQIHLVYADGTSEVTLGPGAHPAWSPDGAQLAFSDMGDIRVMAIDGSEITTLIHGDFTWGNRGFGKPAWSPDGQLITFEDLGDGDTRPAHIIVMNADGSEPRRLTPTLDIQDAESDPSWSPDGARIAFWSSRFGITTADPVLGTPHSVYDGGAVYGARPVWSPDGERIAFTVQDSGIWVVGSDSSDPQLLIPHGYDPAWSPGTSLAFVSLADCADGWKIVFSPGDESAIEDFFGGFYHGGARIQDLTVRVGEPVTWVNFSEVGAHIVSLSEPVGGAAFDSGVLISGTSSRFVPNVAGTWEFVETGSGFTASITADFTAVPPGVTCGSAGP
jgi:Tol biopolymer transport system component